MHPDQHGVKRQSLAEARIPIGEKTRLHLHEKTEELYHITQGVGIMTLGDEQFEARAGDTICISPGMKHCIENTGTEELVILCCCSPAYAHDDVFF